jgi:hypothetical protein
MFKFPNKTPHSASNFALVSAPIYKKCATAFCSRARFRAQDCADRAGGFGERQAAEQACRITGIYPWLHDVLCNDRTRPNDDMAANRYRQDRGIRADTHMIADFGCRPERAVPVCRAAGPKKVVDEHHAVGDDAVVADDNKVANKSMRLDFAAFADDGAALNLYKRAHEGVVSNGTAIKIGRLDNRDVVAKSDVHNARFSYFRFFHEGFKQ